MIDRDQLRAQVKERWGNQSQQTPTQRPAYGAASPNGGAQARTRPAPSMGGGSKGGPRPSGPVGGQQSAKGGTPMSGMGSRQGGQRSAKGGTPMSGRGGFGSLGAAAGGAMSGNYGGAWDNVPEAQRPRQATAEERARFDAIQVPQGGNDIYMFGGGQGGNQAQGGMNQQASNNKLGGFASSGSFNGPQLNVSQPMPSGFSMGGGYMAGPQNPIGGYQGNPGSNYGPQQPMAPQIQGNPNMRPSPVDSIGPFATYAKR